MYQNDINYLNTQDSESSIEIIYTEWNSLKEYKPTTDICFYFLRNVSTTIIEPQYQWKEKFQAITELRSLLKSIPTLFFSVFSITDETIKHLLCDSPTFLTKNILLFLRELFSDFQDETSPEANQLLIWLKEFVPVVLIKMTSSINLIKIEASNLLYVITENMLYFDVLIIFLEECTNKNKEIVKVAFKAFDVLYSNIDVVYLKEYTSCAWAQMFDIVIKIFQMKGVLYEKSAFRFLMRISTIWNNIASYADDEQKDWFNTINRKREISINSKSNRKPDSKHDIQKDKINYAFEVNKKLSNGFCDTKHNYNK